MKKGIAVPEDQLREFGKRVRQVREHLRLQQNEFAAGVGRSESYICQIEKGNGNPTFEFFYEMAKKYNISIDYLIYGKGDMIFNREITGFEETESKNAIDTLDDLIWYLDHSSLFRMKILIEGKQFLYDKAEMIRKDIQEERKKHKK
jgi:transcriptional regulator with XRE-family HTH domain